MIFRLTAATAPTTLPAFRSRNPVRDDVSFGTNRFGTVPVDTKPVPCATRRTFRGMSYHESRIGPARVSREGAAGR